MGVGHVPHTLFCSFLNNLEKFGPLPTHLSVFSDIGIDEKTTLFSVREDSVAPIDILNH